MIRSACPLRSAELDAFSRVGSFDFDYAEIAQRVAILPSVTSMADV